jgi:uncharacterized membrane protein YjfL (UPF0719 family)
MIKLTHSKGNINAGLAIGGLLGAAIPIIATVATAGVAAVPMVLWLGLGGAVSALFAGNVERKSDVERSLDRDANETKSDGV